MAGKKDLERLRRRKRRKQNIIRATVHFFVWAGVAVLYYVGFSLFFDTPVEYELKHSTDRLRREYAALTQRYDSLTTVMHNLSERDRNVFRILFESDPYDFDSEYERRQAVTYENIFNRSSRRLKLELRERVADMEKRLDELNASYLDHGTHCLRCRRVIPVLFYPRGSVVSPSESAGGMSSTAQGQGCGREFLAAGVIVCPLSSRSWFRWPPPRK